MCLLPLLDALLCSLLQQKIRFIWAHPQHDTVYSSPSFSSYSHLTSFLLLLNSCLFPFPIKCFFLLFLFFSFSNLIVFLFSCLYSFNCLIVFSFLNCFFPSPEILSFPLADYLLFSPLILPNSLPLSSSPVKRFFLILRNSLHLLQRTWGSSGTSIATICSGRSDSDNYFPTVKCQKTQIKFTLKAQWR